MATTVGNIAIVIYLRLAMVRGFGKNPELNAGTIAVQYVLSQLSDADAWETDVSDRGLSASYNRYFGDPFQDAIATVPQGFTQPPMTLPFPRGEIWLFTGGFHGGWGDGSAWAAVDFAPPAEQDDQAYCYISSFPVSAVAAGSIVRLNEGVVVLDLDRDGNEGSGWTILYLHVNQVSGLREGQVVEAGQVLGYASCPGRFFQRDSPTYCPSLQWRMDSCRLRALSDGSEHSSLCDEQLAGDWFGTSSLSRIHVQESRQ